MRFLGQTLLAGVFVLGACAGGDKAANSDTATAAPASDTLAAAAPAASAATAGAPITGTIHEVKMIGDEKGYRYEPADFTIKQGDGVKFIMVSGGPHNVGFDAADLPAGAADVLKANMPNQQSPLQGPFMMNPEEAYTISFAGVPAGKYPYHCLPHLAMNMKGVITVE
ncbi:MAG TPA: plastocyanin/azurin family copper-binding protein [Gemmatimonadaceae bacterium]